MRGRHLVVSCGHYLAALAGMRMRDLGGNVPMLIYDARSRRVVAINGNMRAPAAATIEWFRARAIRLIPGDGFLPAGVCAAPDALITALDRFGRLTLRDVAAPAIELAADGFPLYEAMRNMIAGHEHRFRAEWPSSAALFLPGGAVPALGETWRNPDLARTFEKMVEAEQNARHLGRSAALRAARDRFYKGDIAREIVAFQRETRVRDANGFESNGLLTEEDFATFKTRIEDPVTGVPPAVESA